MLKTPLLTVTVIALIACSKNGFSTIAQEVPSGADEAGLVLGTYDTGCVVADMSSRRTEVSATEIAITDSEYEDGACATKSMDYHYTYAYTDVGASTSITDTRNVNLVEGKMFMTPRSPTAVTDWNNGNHCGFNDWQLDVTKDVSADPTCQYLPVGTITYSIARTMNDTLELGEPVDWLDPNEGTTDQLRFTVFEDPQQKQ